MGWVELRRENPTTTGWALTADWTRAYNQSGDEYQDTQEQEMTMHETMTKTGAGSEVEQVVTQIDAIIPELLALRRRLTVAAPASSPTTASTTAELYGALGNGSWEEYDPDVDWVQFGAL
jgi:hypothetical protein